MVFESSSNSSSIPRTFGQLLTPSLSSMNTLRPTASCPCCSFIGGDLFLPYNEGDEKQPDGDSNLTAEDNGATQRLGVISPIDSWKTISGEGSNGIILLVDTHGHPHLQRDMQYGEASSGEFIGNERLISLTCAVSPLDWNDALKYASRSQLILPALGVHPWYLGDILRDYDQPEETDDTTSAPHQLSQHPKVSIGEKYLQWDWLTELEHHISQHPNAVVGEIGLCKMARFVREFPKEHGGKATALQLQKLVFRKQLELAARWSRPVTVHCVNMHGAFMDILKEIFQETKESYNRESKANESISLQMCLRKAFPPSIAMHSFTGTAYHVQQILEFEREIFNPDQANDKRGLRRKKKQGGDAAKEMARKENKEESLFYFGFSHAVNHIMCTSDKAKRKGVEAVRAVPSDRLLAESDVHATSDVTLGTAGAIAYISSARGEELRSVAKLTTMNGLKYLHSLAHTSQLSVNYNN